MHNAIQLKPDNTKKCWRSCCVQDEFMVARPCDHHSKRSRGNCFEGTWSRKMRFSLLSKLYLNRPQMRANVFHSRCGKDLNGSAGSAIKNYSAQGETCAVDETIRAAIVI
ncbi:PREDICTED: uncharacterized protein LOC105155065 [Acromyrmex echinatior]|uniref:uncharacterized protein LOC105155065 n=1 Tax=Acromyrmex echinatior TaxID=103372 RepID=UPI000580C269|nr:PREDICTED: uncharacterized protein LOC105155065 [Acromyrmex echinatior]